MTSVVNVHVRTVSDDPGLAELLDDAERVRGARRRDPARYITAHALLRSVVAERTGEPPTAIVFDRRCMTCGSTAHGKPVVRGHPTVFVSLSYAGNVAAVALTSAGDVGVDVEQVADADHQGFEASTLAPEEAPAFGAVAAYRLAMARAQVWARKEAVLKATGHGLVVDPRDVVVSGPDEHAELVAWRGEPPIGSPVQLLDVSPGLDGYAVAVAVLSSIPVRLEVIGC